VDITIPGAPPGEPTGDVSQSAPPKYAPHADAKAIGSL
jgi:hypothetical protein